MSYRGLPSGTLTFLFTDIEGSTKLLNALGTDRYHEVLATHTKTLRAAFAGGTEVRIEGDALFLVFDSAAKAVRAAAAAQRALAATRFPHDVVVRVRMGMHTGDGVPASKEAGADYVGIDVHRAARIANVAHGGQVLLSGATATLAGPDLGDGTTLRDLGEHRLDRKSTRLNSSHSQISYAVFCLKKKKGRIHISMWDRASGVKRRRLHTADRLELRRVPERPDASPGGRRRERGRPQ